MVRDLLAPDVVVRRGTGGDYVGVLRLCRTDLLREPPSRRVRELLTEQPSAVAFRSGEVAGFIYR